MKRFSISLIAVLMAFGFAAFTTAKQAGHKAFSYTYKYNGTTVGGENTAANYEESTSQSGCNDAVPTMVCTIVTSYAPDEFGNPEFPASPNVRTDGNISIQHWQPVP